MKKLIQGIVDFRNKRTEESREAFAQLALGQQPDALFIGCSDSRVAPNVFASTNPGDLFVMRNIGNLVPPASASLKETSVPAVLEFSVCTLQVSDIIVCGHSECGAIQALVQEVDASCCPHLKTWLKYAREALYQVRSGHTVDPDLSELNQISQMNVLEQMKHVATYSYVQERMQKNLLRIHGWWFDIAKADVYCYESSVNHFILIDEVEAEKILKRMQ